MFGFLKSDPLKKLNREYEALLKEAMEAQRSGDIRLYSELTEQAEKISEKIEQHKTTKAL